MYVEKEKYKIKSKENKQINKQTYWKYMYKK